MVQNNQNIEIENFHRPKEYGKVERLITLQPTDYTTDPGPEELPSLNFDLLNQIFYFLVKARFNPLFSVKSKSVLLSLENSNTELINIRNQSLVLKTSRNVILDILILDTLYEVRNSQSKFRKKELPRPKSLRIVYEILKKKYGEISWTKFLNRLKTLRNRGLIYMHKSINKNPIILVKIPRFWGRRTGKIRGAPADVYYLTEYGSWYIYKIRWEVYCILGQLSISFAS